MLCRAGGRDHDRHRVGLCALRFDAAGCRRALWIKPVIIAVVVQALWRLWPSAARTPSLIFITIAATVAALLGFNEIAILFATGFLTIGLYLIANREWSRGSLAAGAIATSPAMRSTTSAVEPAIAGAAVAPFNLAKMFLIFLKIGAVLFGSGYVLIAFLQGDFVDRLHWLTRGQLLDAVAVGQFTPGPVFCTATFIGYLMGSTTGAIVATIGIFLPAFFSSRSADRCFRDCAAHRSLVLSSTASTRPRSR